MSKLLNKIRRLLNLQPANAHIQESGELMHIPSNNPPGARGLFHGTVKQNHGDPENQFRILVDVPLLNPDGKGIWARLTNFYSTHGAGAFFLPEEGDEVIIGLMNEDARYPIILGSMYSNPDIKPFKGLTSNETNALKALVSREGLSLQFDDKNKILTLRTPGGNKAILSDQAKEISLEDENGNSLVMDIRGITLNSSKTITLHAAQNLVLKGEQGVSTESRSGIVKIKGINIEETADVSYTAQGGASAKVQAGAELTLRGTIVRIN